ncbi:hypothetical protein DRE_03302 [Drechslerella stenobrocha 248]|uniref:Stc1 domain-containing protein n=1 Tax=Drechslerella stenobrocha 248 TaxID=1043628 RepID=W7I5D9_9PEZI|nr:hypothetical protein DRE_03302 [Drechslerella stenobrocha 248]
MPPPQLPKIDKNLYNQGSSRGSNSASGRISYPDNIVCYVCNREKPQSQYSTRQLTRWRSTIYQPYAPGGRVRGEARTTCKACTPDQTTELTCIVCGETNGLSHFANAQRKNPDRARCKVCIKEQSKVAIDLDPQHSDVDTDSDDEDDDELDLDFDTGKPIIKNQPTKAKKATNGSTTNSLTWDNLASLDSGSNNEDIPGGWSTKKSGKLASETQSNFSYQANSRDHDESSRSALSTIAPRDRTNMSKSGWAKPQKIKKKNNPESQNSGYSGSGFGSDDDADGGSNATSSGYRVRKPKLNSEFDTDPWSSRYK